jgi:hypothetical protein
LPRLQACWRLLPRDIRQRGGHENFRKPDVVIGTRDWEIVERFLCNVEPDRNAGLRETRKHHVRIVLQGGERWYLNLLVSETARRSRITSAAAAKLGQGSVHDKRMHLRDVNGIEVSITVDVVDTTRELLDGKDSHLGAPKPHMVLTPGDERRIQGMMLTGWMGKADLLKGWASQGKKKGQPASEARGRGAGEQVYFKHLKVRTEGRTLRISALFDRNVPDTTVGYGAATILGGGKPGAELRLVQRTPSGHGRTHQAGEGEWRAENGPRQEGWRGLR